MKKPCLTWIGLGVLAVVLAGCASYVPRPLAPVDTAAAFAARRLDDPGLKAFLETDLGHPLAVWPPATWDEPLLTLAAFYYHPDLDVARAQWAVAQAATITAGARPNPRAATSAQYNTDTTAGQSPWTWALDLAFPVETAGKRDLRRAQTQHLADKTRLEIATVAWRVRSELRRRLIENEAAQRRVMLLDRQQAALAAYLGTLERRAAAGNLSFYELSQTRQAFDHARLAGYDAQRRAAEGRVRLAAAVGLPVQALEGIVLASVLERPPIETGPLTDAQRAEALQRRPDILGALSAYAAAEAALALEIARQYPDLDLGPGYTWDAGASKWSLGLALTLPMFHRNAGPIAEAEARRAEAAARFNALQAGVFTELDAAAAGYRVALAQWRAAVALRDATHGRVAALRARLRRGEAAQPGRLNADVELAAVEIAELDAHVGVQQALATLEDAVARPLDAHAASPHAPEIVPPRREVRP